MIIKTLRLGLLAAAVAISSAAVVRAETLADALISAYRSSGLLEQNRALLRAADEDVATSMALLRPVLSYALGANYSTVTQQTFSNLEVTASILLYDFGASRLRIDASKENVLALREALISVEQNVLLRAVVSYTRVRREISIVALRENNMALIAQELQATRDRFEVGEVTRTDVAIAEARLASARSFLAVARGDLFSSREEYLAAVGQYPGTLAPPPFPPALAKSLPEARRIAGDRHPDVLQAKRTVTVAELNIAIAQAAMKPAIYANARGSLGQDGNEDGFVGVTLSGPIYQGGALMSARRRAAAQRDATRSGLLLTGIRINQNVGNAWAQLIVADAALLATTEEIIAARIAFEGVREEARFGARTTLDVLDAEQELLDAEFNKIAADTSRYNAVYGLLSTMGLLTVDHLRLGIATYDPAVYYNAVKDGPVYNVSPQGEKLNRVLKSIGKN